MQGLRLSIPYILWLGFFDRVVIQLGLLFTDTSFCHVHVLWEPLNSWNKMGCSCWLVYFLLDEVSRYPWFYVTRCDYFALGLITPTKLFIRDPTNPSRLSGAYYSLVLIKNVNLLIFYPTDSSGLSVITFCEARQMFYLGKFQRTNWWDVYRIKAYTSYMWGHAKAEANYWVHPCSNLKWNLCGAYCTLWMRWVKFNVFSNVSIANVSPSFNLFYIGS